MPFDMEEVYEALDGIDAVMEPSAMLKALSEGKTGEEIFNVPRRRFDEAIKDAPRFGDLRRHEFRPPAPEIEWLNYIASNIFLYLGMEIPEKRVLKNMFTPGRFYGEFISVHTGSVVDNGAILLPPVMIGRGCSVGDGAVIGPYSCIAGITIGERAYTIKSIMGNFGPGKRL